MTVVKNLAYDKAYVEKFSADNNEPEWMKQFRLDALSQAESLDMPKPDKTNINRWNFTEFKHESVEAEEITSLNDLPQELREYIDVDQLPENILIQRNQTVAYTALNKELQDKGVILTDIFTAVKEHSDLVQKFYMQDAVKVDEHRLTALHAALMNGGAFVYVPKNVVVEEPLQTIFWQEAEDTVMFNHVLVVADEGAELTYVENYLNGNDDKATVANIVTEAIALDNAKIAFGGVDQFGKETTTYINRRGVAYNNATIDWALGQMNDGNTVSENISHLVGNGSSSDMKTVVVGRGKQIENFTSKTVHFGLDSVGHILQHAVLGDAATSVFNGIGKIEDGATRADAVQESRVLMLSEKARGDANPILLIDEDDVTAGHAASVGRIDEMQMYYLRSRGLEAEEARRLIIHGFLEPVVAQLPIESVKQQLKDVIEGKIT